MQQVLDQAVRRLELVLGLSPHAAARALAEVLDCFDSVEEAVEAFATANR